MDELYIFNILCVWHVLNNIYWFSKFNNTKDAKIFNKCIYQIACVNLLLGGIFIII